MYKNARTTKPRARAFGLRLLALALVAGSSFTVFFHGSIASLLAAVASSLSPAPIVVYFSPDADTRVSVGDTIDVDLDVSAQVPINAIGATVQFPKNELEVVGISKEKSFLNLWTEDTVIKEESGELHFSGGTTEKGGQMGTSTALTISVRATASGEAVIAIKDFQVYAADGKGTPLPYATRTLSLSISQPAPKAAAAPTAENQSTTSTTTESLYASLRGNGPVTALDVYLMIIHLVLPYDPTFDLDSDGSVGLTDLSILFSRMRTQ